MDRNNSRAGRFSGLHFDAAPLIAAACTLALLGTVAYFHFASRERHIPAPIPSQMSRPVPETPPPREDGEIRDRVSDGRHAALDQIYQAFNYAPIWNGHRSGALQPVTAQMAREGIDTSALKAASSAPAGAARDIAVTAAVLRLAQAERTGAIPAQVIASYWMIAPQTFDEMPALITALRKNDLPAYFARLAPQDAGYKKLTDALARYRAMETWPEIPGTTEVKLDGTDTRAKIVAARLAAEGYLGKPDDAPLADIRTAVSTFQARNGLTPDGRIGKTTLAALNISSADRADQIAANLERWRRLPRDLGADHVTANTADVGITLFRNGEPAMTMRAIAGDRKHPTPVLAARITAVTFNPVWDIPPSIAGKEILPKLKKDPTYLAANNMIVVDGSLTDPHGLYMNWTHYTPGTMPWRLRQMAGTDNSLGLVKFDMANPYNIYLHDTPARTLFAKDERHLSHGCVRLQEPRKLAAELLSGRPDTWDADAVDAAIAAHTTRVVALPKPLPVYVLYQTAFIGADGALNFREDAYHRDQPIADALAQPLAPQPDVSAGTTNVAED